MLLQNSENISAEIKCKYILYSLYEVHKSKHLQYKFNFICLLANTEGSSIETDQIII